MSKLIEWEQNVKNDGLFSMYINLTNSCYNENPSSDEQGGAQTYLHLYPLQDFLVALKYKGLNDIILSGEPFLYQDLTELVVWFKKRDLSYSVITTLNLPFPANLIRVAETAERFHVSIVSVDKKEYEKIRGCAHFDDVFKNLKAVQLVRERENKSPARINTTVSKLNYKSVFDIYNKLVKEMGCTLNFYFEHTWKDLFIDKYKNELLQLFAKIVKDDKDGATNAENMILQLLKKSTASLIKPEACCLPTRSIALDVDGSIYPCYKFLNSNRDCEEQLKYSYGNFTTNYGNYYRYTENITSIISKMHPIKTDSNEICNYCAQKYDELKENNFGMHNGIEKPHFYFSFEKVFTVKK